MCTKYLRQMQKRNTLVLLGVLALTGVWMTLLHLALFRGQGLLGISGIGMTGVVLLILNRPWLLPNAEPLPRLALRRSVTAALILGASFVLLFGAIGS